MPDAPSAVVGAVTAMPQSPGAPRTPRRTPRTPGTSGPPDGQSPASSPAAPALWRPLFPSFGSSDATTSKNKDGGNDTNDEARAATTGDNHGGSGGGSSSSTASSSSSSPNNDPVAEGSREVLIDRLQDVVRHLASYVPAAAAAGTSLSSPGQHVRGSHLRARRADDRVLSALHARVDEMEAVLAAAEAEAEAAVDAATASSTTPSPGLASSPFRHDRTRSSLSSLGTAASNAAAAAAAAATGEPGSPLSSLRQRSSLLVRPASILTGRQPSASWHAEAPLWGRGLSPRQEQRPKVGEGRRVENDPTTETSKTLARESAHLADELAAALARLTTTSRDAEAIQQALLNELTAARGQVAALETQVAALQQQVPKTPTPAAAPPSPHSAKDDNRNSVFAVTSPSASTASAVSMTASTTTVTGSHLETIDAELSFLRLQLRAIELRCRTHVPEDADPELAESIANWKADWAALRAQVDEEEHSLQQSMTSGGLYAMYE